MGVFLGVFLPFGFPMIKAGAPFVFESVCQRLKHFFGGEERLFVQVFFPVYLYPSTTPNVVKEALFPWNQKDFDFQDFTIGQRDQVQKDAMDCPIVNVGDKPYGLALRALVLYDQGDRAKEIQGIHIIWDNIQSLGYFRKLGRFPSWEGQEARDHRIHAKAATEIQDRLGERIAELLNKDAGNENKCGK